MVKGYNAQKTRLPATTERAQPERSLIHDEVDSLASGQLSPRMLSVDTLLASTEKGLGSANRIHVIHQNLSVKFVVTNNHLDVSLEFLESQSNLLSWIWLETRRVCAIDELAAATEDWKRVS